MCSQTRFRTEMRWSGRNDL